MLGTLNVDGPVTAATTVSCKFCKQTMLLDGVHAFSCKAATGLRTTRHHKITNLLARVVYRDRAAAAGGGGGGARPPGGGRPPPPPPSRDMSGHLPLPPHCDDHEWPRKPDKQNGQSLRGDISERREGDPANPRIRAHTRA
jgi:hypothetical protein